MTDNFKINPIDIIRFKKDGGIIENEFKSKFTTFDKFFFYNIDEEYDWISTLKIIKNFTLLNEKWRLPNWQEVRAIYDYQCKLIERKEGGLYYYPENFEPRKKENYNTKFTPYFWIDDDKNDEDVAYYFSPGYLGNDNYTRKSSKCRIILVA